MMAVFKYQNREVRFRISLVKNYKTDVFDYELHCVNEPPCPEYHLKVIPFEVFQKAWRSYKIEVLLDPR